ncbi:MAG: hypothetical protein R3F02_19575 [Thiolinea sp.]
MVLGGSTTDVYRFRQHRYLLAAGTCTLTANQASNDDYEAASEVPKTSP